MATEPARITASFLDVVEVLIAAGGDKLHGWSIIKQTGLGGPTVYKNLERLSAMDWVIAEWDQTPEDPTKPRRRYYTLTANGAARAKALLAARRPQKAPANNPRFAFGGGAL